MSISKSVAALVCAAALVLLPGCKASAPQARTSQSRSATGRQRDGARLDRFWARALQETYRSPQELAAQHARELRHGLRYDLLVRGNPGERAVALTFDDGPHPDYTPRLLAILRRYGVPATFFVVGEMAEAHPELIRAERAAGHVIGNHTYHHVNLTRIPTPEIATEWQACQEVVQSITGEAMHFCRPPGGDYDRDVIAAATALGLTTVLWTDDPGDYARPGDRTIETRVLARVSNGGIILIHDGVQQTIDVLPQIIHILKQRGFSFVTVADMRQGSLSPWGPTQGAGQRMGESRNRRGQ